MALLSSINWAKEHPSVQELAREPLNEVPQKYVLDAADDPVADCCNSSLQLPLISMAALMASDSREEELQKLCSACRDWGTFQLINHGVDDELIGEIKKQTKEFYNLPLEEKMRWAHKEDSLEGYGQPFINNQRLQWSDMMFINGLPIEDRNFNFWPDNPHGFRETIDRYTKEIRKVAVSLLGFMGLAIGVDSNQFSEICEDGVLQIRMNYYPPCPQPERVIGSSPHTDITSITCLLEFDDTPGLQVQKDGHWVTATPVPGAMNVIVGHISEIMSNGIYKAAEHRAVVNGSKVRISIICFFYTDKNATFKPVQDLLTPHSPANYKAVSLPEYFASYFEHRPGGGQFIDTLKVDRA